MYVGECAAVCRYMKFNASRRKSTKKVSTIYFCCRAGASTISCSNTFFLASILTASCIKRSAARRWRWRQQCGDKTRQLFWFFLSFFPTFCQIANSVSDVHCSASTRFYAKHAGAAAVPIHLRNVGIAKKSEMPQERTEIPRTSLMMESSKKTCETPTRCRTFMILKVPLLTICCGSSSASAASRPHNRCLAPRLHCQQSYRQQRPERRSRLSLSVKEKCKWR